MPIVQARPVAAGSSRPAATVIVAVLALVVLLAGALFFMKSGTSDAEPKGPVAGPAPVAKSDPGKAAREQAKLASEVQELEAKAKPILEREQFAAALDLYDEARKRHAGPEWEKAVQKRIDDVRAQHTALYQSIKVKATGAQLQGASAEVQTHRSRIVGWGIREWVDDLDKALAAVIPREPLPPGATVLIRFPEGLPAGVQLEGTRRSDGLLARDRKDAVWAGLESGKQILKVPETGEVRITFTTNKPALVTVICRATDPEKGKNLPYNFWIRNPVLGRAQTVKFPVGSLTSWDKSPIKPGMVVDNIYFQQDDVTAALTIHEFVIFTPRK